MKQVLLTICVALCGKHPIDPKMEKLGREQVTIIRYSVGKPKDGVNKDLCESYNSHFIFNPILL